MRDDGPHQKLTKVRALGYVSFATHSRLSQHPWRADRVRFGSKADTSLMAGMGGKRTFVSVSIILVDADLPDLVILNREKCD